MWTFLMSVKYLKRQICRSKHGASQPFLIRGPVTRFTLYNVTAKLFLKALTVLRGPLAYPNGLSQSTYRDIW
jgi:hypothetical protein